MQQVGEANSADSFRSERYPKSPEHSRHVDTRRNQQVEEGEVRKEDKTGNDAADRAADQGVKLHRPGAVEFMMWLNARRKAYAKLMKNISTVIAGMLVKYHEERTDRERMRRKRDL